MGKEKEEMKKYLALLLVALMLLTAIPAMADISDYNIVTSAETHKVILDTDMGYFGDDTYALMILLQADAAGYLDLLGVTSVGANTTIAQGTTAILNQLEALGRSDIPVAMGTDIPIMGLKTPEQMAANGLKEIRCFATVRKYGNTISYDNLGDLVDPTWGYSSLKPVEKPAWEFMIEQVHKYPGQVTIMAIGACTNVAMAIMTDPTFAENTAGIYYMGGAIDVPGNDTPCAERNWYYDPESVAICLAAKFPVQVVVPHDISYNQKLTKDIMDKFVAANQTAYTKLIKEYAYPRFEQDPTRKQSLWDAQVPGIFLSPDLISSTDVRQIAMVTDLGYSYGESVAWKNDLGPAASTYCTVVYDVHGEEYWNFVVDLLSTEF